MIGRVRAQVSWPGWIGASRPIALVCCALWAAAFLFDPIIHGARADDAPKIEAGKNAGELKMPDGLLVDNGKGGKTLRPTKCPDDCKAEWEALKAALQAYYAAMSAEGYQNLSNSKKPEAKDQEKNGNTGMKDILGMSDKEMAEARKKYYADKKDAKKKDSLKPDALLKAINDALKALLDCEKTHCGGGTTTGEGGTTTGGGGTMGGGGTKTGEGGDNKDSGTKVCHYPGFDDLPDPAESVDDVNKIVDWCKGIKLPTCSNDKDKTKKNWEQVRADVKTAMSRMSQAKFGAAIKAAKEGAPACQAVLDKIDDFLKNKVSNLPPCSEGQKEEWCPDKEGSYYVPPYRTPGTFNVSEDSGPNCTHDNATPKEVAYTPISSGGGVLANYTPATPAGGGPQDGTPGTPPSGGAPTAEKSPGGGTPENPPKQSTPEEQPKQPTTENPPPPTTTTENPPPPTTTTDNPPPPPIEITITVEVFDKENVLVAGHTEQGAGLDGQLLMLGTVKPSLTRGGDDDSAADPAKCITKTGHCTIRIQRRYAAALGVPDNATQLRLDLSAKKHSSALAETTGKTIKSDLASALPPGVELATQTFKVGARTFMVFNFAAPYNNTDDLLALVSGLIKIALETNWCDDGKPAAGLSNPAAAPGATGSALPAATLGFGNAVRTGRAVR